MSGRKLLTRLLLLADNCCNQAITLIENCPTGVNE